MLLGGVGLYTQKQASELIAQIVRQITPACFLGDHDDKTPSRACPSANLEAARLKLIETLAAREGIPNPDALRELATIHAALSAVREEIETHSARLGWGDSGELD